MKRAIFLMFCFLLVQLAGCAFTWTSTTGQFVETQACAKYAQELPFASKDEIAVAYSRPRAKASQWQSASGNFPGLLRWLFPNKANFGVEFKSGSSGESKRYDVKKLVALEDGSSGYYVLKDTRLRIKVTEEIKSQATSFKKGAEYCEETCGLKVTGSGTREYEKTYHLNQVVPVVYFYMNEGNDSENVDAISDVEIGVVRGPHRRDRLLVSKNYGACQIAQTTDVDCYSDDDEKNGKR